MPRQRFTRHEVLLATFALVGTTGCASLPEVEPLDAAVSAELRQIADVLSRPHEFPVGKARSGRTVGTAHPYDFGCAFPEDFLPEGHWMRHGLPLGLSHVRAWDPTDSSRAPKGPVAHACWRLEQLGCVGLFRDRLAAILEDSTLGDAMRCQAAHALGSSPNLQTATVLARHIDSDVVGPECLRALVLIGPVRLDGLRAAGLPKTDPARSRVMWLLTHHVDDLTTAEFRWLANALETPSSPASVWTLWLAYHTAPHSVVRALLPLLERDDPPPAALALAVRAGIRDPCAVDAVLAHARDHTGAIRQLALQHLGRIESPRALDLLMRFATADGTTTGDRAAAILGLSNYRAREAEWIKAAVRLLPSPEPALRRAALWALCSPRALPDEVVALVKPMKNDDDYFVWHFAGMVLRTRR